MGIKKAKVFFLMLGATLLIPCGGGLSSGYWEKAQSIILFIGDGMGSEQLKAVRWSLAGEDGRLAIDDMPFKGALHTRSANNAVTDSAAAATAIATGVKTNNRVIGLDRSLNPLRTILEEAKALGKSVGIVTTVSVSHATPAAFAAHVTDRRQMTEAALQMVEGSIDVLLGGGESEFLPTSHTGCFPERGNRTDGRNLINEAVLAGYTYVCDDLSFEEIDPLSTTQLLGLFADDGLLDPSSPSLAELTEKAIAILSQNPNGFFLMVEAGQIDWAGHNNDGERMIANVLGLDQAVIVGKAYASTNEGTLVIITADHETGGATFSETAIGSVGEDGPFFTPGGTPFFINWATEGHTSVDVPIMASGPSAERLLGDHDNTFLFDVMAGAFGISP